MVCEATGLDEITKRVSYMGRRSPKAKSWSTPDAKSSGRCGGPVRVDSGYSGNPGSHVKFEGSSGQLSHTANRSSNRSSEH